MYHPWQSLNQPWLGRVVALRERHGACLCRCDHVAPMVAHACAARRGSSTGRGWGGQSRRAIGTVRARVAAITSRQWLHTHALPAEQGHAPPAEP